MGSVRVIVSAMVSLANPITFRFFDHNLGDPQLLTLAQLGLKVSSCDSSIHFEKIVIDQ